MANAIEKLTEEFDKAKKSMVTKKDVESLLESKAYELGAKTKQYFNKSEEIVKENLSTLEEKIKEKPLVAVVSAFALGVILSKFLGSKD